MSEQGSAGAAPDAYDVVVVGVGLSGLATALSASLRGLRAVIVEKEPRLQGASWWSGGQVWVPANHVQQREGKADSLEEGMAYVRGFSAERPDLIDEEHLKRWLTVAPEAVRWFEEQGAATFSIIPGYPDYAYPEVAGSRPEGRYLSATYDANRLGEWRDKLSLAMWWPVGVTYEELLGVEKPAEERGPVHQTSAFGTNAAVHEPAAPVGADLLTMGPGVLGGFLVRALESGVDVRLGHRVTEVVLRDGRAVGVRATTEAGDEVELSGAVVIATSSFDHDPELLEEFWGLGQAVSLAPPNIAGDGVRLARGAGAEVVAWDPEFASVYPGHRTHLGPGFTTVMEYSMPHSFIVDRHGRRFANDSLQWTIGRGALDRAGDHLPVYMIWDEQHHQRYGLGGTPPGEPYPDDLPVRSAATLRELGDALGIDGGVLDDTAARFNVGAAEGQDPDFGRGTAHFARVLAGDPTHPIHPNVAPVQQAPFHGMRLLLGGAGVGLAGIRIDADAHALDESGTVVPGLYAAGSAAVYSSSGVGYNSGYALSRAITHGYLIGADLARAAAT